MNNNVTIQMFRQMAQQVAKLWADYIRPMPFEATFHIGAVEVELKIREAEPNTRPVFGKDEDDRIADG